jgi:hypothetical protein
LSYFFLFFLICFYFYLCVFSYFYV